MNKVNLSFISLLVLTLKAMLSKESDGRLELPYMLYWSLVLLSVAEVTKGVAIVVCEMTLFIVFSLSINL